MIIKRAAASRTAGLQTYIDGAGRIGPLFAEHRQTSAYRPWHFLVNGLAASRLIADESRPKLLALAGLDVDASASLLPGCYFISSKIVVGGGALISGGAYFENPHALIRLGERCFLGPRVTILTSSHEIGSPDSRAGDLTAKAVEVRDGTWLGSGVIVLPGITIGEGCVVAAGAVVTNDLAPHGLYAGVPATRKRDLPSADGE